MSDKQNRDNQYLEKDFRCGYCKNMVPADSPSTAHRNHCTYCGYSKHVDYIKGKRDSNCRSLMKPVALAWKGGGEITLVHLCLGCNDLNYNRISAEDNTEMILGVYETSKSLDSEIIKIINDKEIKLITPDEEEEVIKALFGKVPYIH
jgi:DNA-directed RNA polymerase subunit RPC12/RpoP